VVLGNTLTLDDKIGDATAQEAYQELVAAAACN
jgi:hypothetical protein